MFKDYFDGKNVLVTGADGFMGSHLTEALHGYGANVSALIRPSSDVNGYRISNLSHLKDELEILVGDVGSPDIISIVEGNPPDVIFHLAALAYVNYSFEHPMEVTRVNLNGTLNMLEASRKIDVERLVVTSSSEVYGPAQTAKIDESHPLNPTSPYAASKVAADRYAYSYWRTYHLPVGIIRPFNTYGPRHTYDVIPKFIGMVLRGEAPTIYGSGEQSRDFTYVSDMIDAFLHMGSNAKGIGEVVNFGTGKDVTIKELAQEIIDISGEMIKPIYLPERPAEVSRLCCDYGKAKRLFSWEPVVGIREGLRQNIEWARKYEIN